MIRSLHFHCRAVEYGYNVMSSVINIISCPPNVWMMTLWGMFSFDLFWWSARKWLWSRSRRAGGQREHNMNNNKDPCSNECRAHKSLFIVDWFLCPAPDECIQMEIAILCHTQHNGSYLKVMLCIFLGLHSFKRHLYHHIKCDLPFFILTNKLLF